MASRSQGFSTGATYGATLGAGVGSVIPGVGTVVGGAVGGAIGGIGGWLFSGESDEEKKRRKQYEALQDELLLGKIPDDQRAMIEKSLQRRFGQLRGEAGAGFARSGMMNSTMRQTAGLGAVQGERDALADALTRYSEQRRAQGISMYQQERDIQRQEAAATADSLGNIASLATFLYFDPYRNAGASGASSSQGSAGATSAWSRMKG